MAFISCAWVAKIERRNILARADSYRPPPSFDRVGDPRLLQASPR